MPDADDLKQVVAALHDGEKFYVDAANEIADSSHQEMFRLMAMTKREIADDLTALLPAGRSDSIDGTWIGKIRESYAHCRALLGTDKDLVFIDLLESAEDRVIAAFRDCLSTTRKRKVRDVLERHYPRALAAHERMRALKKTAHSH